MIKYLQLIIERTDELIQFKNLRQQKCSFHSFKSEIVRNSNYRPVFFLSTGRCGTKLFSNLIAKDKSFFVVHTSNKDLIEQGKMFYVVSKDQELNVFQGGNVFNKLGSQIFTAARDEVLYKAYLHKKLYLETNNRITFLAPAINYWMPGARFVHIIRHPGYFVRSGILRGWYTGNHPHDHGRITPVDGTPEYIKWDSWDAVQKISWLWKETNSFIDQFAESVGKDSVYKFNFDELSNETVQNLMNHLNVSVSESSVAKSVQSPVNVQKSGVFPKYEDWNKNEKEKLAEICGDLAASYGYELD